MIKKKNANGDGEDFIAKCLQPEAATHLTNFVMVVPNAATVALYGLHGRGMCRPRSCRRMVSPSDIAKRDQSRS